MQTTISLKDKVALITGGGSGIGRGVALALAGEGVQISICGRRKEALDETLNQIRELGGVGVAFQADVSKEEDVERLFKETLKAYGRLDILINNAGIAIAVNLYDLNLQTWDRVMDTNLRGPLLTTRQALPIFREQRSGHIINISSESGLEYYPGDAIYGLSKHALNTLSEYAQRESQDYNIRVNTICPGMVVTEMSANEPGLNHAKCLYPEDIADLVIWLLTRRSNVKIGTPILIQTMLNPWE